MLRAVLAVLSLIMAVSGLGFEYIGGQKATGKTDSFANQTVPISTNTRATTIPGRRISDVTSYRINAAQSEFVAHVNSSGLLWFFGHSHRLAVHDFSGTADLTPGSIQNASLQMNIKADSLKESDPKFTDAEKNIITGEVKNLVLESSKYPEITFRSGVVTGKMDGGKYLLQIAGDLTLHGVTHQIVIPAQVTIDNQRLRATGEFSIDRLDYNVKATSVKFGTVRAGAMVTFSFNIVADKE